MLMLHVLSRKVTDQVRFLSISKFVFSTRVTPKPSHTLQEVNLQYLFNQVFERLR